jgi:peptide/nickel transport system substrate-binding protein
MSTRLARAGAALAGRAAGRAALAFAIGLSAAAAPLACVRERPAPPRGVLTVSVEQQASWVRNFNPLSPAAAARWPTLAGVYEPLLVFNSQKGEYVPWLAASYGWSEGGRLLTFELRPGVRWSDGRPLTARDVVFTFELLRRFPALDRSGVWGFLEAVRARGERAVELTFRRPFYPGLYELAPQPIVPEHVWRDVADPVTFANPHPVATGPFTEVRVFERQIFELGRNPHYWQPGRPRLDALRFPAYPSNERANLALVFGEADWAGNFVPAVDRVFVARDPEHHRYWFPLTGSTVFLYANTTREPFDDAQVRKALSLAIDRKLVVDVALYAYSRPSDATGLSDAYARWRDPEIAAAGDWVLHDVARANALLDAAGLARGPDGLRRGAGGAPLRLELLAVSGWSDWVRAAQVISRGLREVGIDAPVRTYDFAAWFQRVQEGRFDLSLGWSVEGPTPYTFYRWLMARETVKPLGTPSTGNWHRYASPAADRLLAAFETEPDPLAQRRLVAELQRAFVAEAPAIPLYPNPSWSAYDTARFTGFPSADDPYADPSPNKWDQREVLLVLTTVGPRED